MAAELNDTKRTILVAAGARTDLRVLPIPETIKVNTTSVEKSLKQMVSAGLLAEIAALAGDVVWQDSEKGGKIALVVTPNGLASVGIEPNPTSSLSQARTRGKAQKARTTPAAVVKSATQPAKASSGASSRAGRTQQDKLIALLRQPKGASIAEMMKATGWQAHSLRGVMSATLKKRLGLPIISEKNEKTGERRYRIAAPRTSRKGA